MIKILVKSFLWLAVGFVAVGASVGNDILQTPWRYTFSSVVAPGTSLTITQPDGEPMHAETAEMSTHQHTVDVGAPVALIGLYVIGSVMGYGLKGRKSRFIEHE